MLPPSNSEIARLRHYSLLRNYQIHRAKYVGEGKIIVSIARNAIEAAMQKQKAVTGNFVYNISDDEVYDVLKKWMPNCKRWEKKVKSKLGLPYRDYDVVTDSIARFMTWDAYSELIR